MTLQNRVQPDGQILAIPARGTMTGNRGILHGPDRTLATKRWSHKAWICCVLDWQGRKRDVMSGRNWTELFFLDEAVAIVAGHRPCGYCRRADYNRFLDAWQGAFHIRPRAPEMDAILHPARVRRDRTQVTHIAGITTLPRGVFLVHNDQPHLVDHHVLRPYTPDGYGASVPRPRCGNVTVLTPAPMVRILDHGYCPALHPTAEHT